MSRVQKRRLKYFFVVVVLTFGVFFTIRAAGPAMHARINVFLGETKKADTSASNQKTKIVRQVVVSKPKAKPNTKLVNDTYELHRAAAKKNGVKNIADHKKLRQLEKENKLVKVKNNTGFKVNKLTHSHALLVPQANEVLKELGVAFQKKSGANNYFTVTSITRTEADQKKLRKKNKNATNGESSHESGVSFDISYIRFNGKKDWNATLQNHLEAVLLDFQNQNKIYVIKERKQNCYHITVR